MFRHYLDGQFLRLDDGAVLPPDAPEVADWIEAGGVVAAAELDERRDTLRRQVDALYAQHLDQGLAHAGKVIQIGGSHTLNITAMAASASAAKSGHMVFPDPFAWRCADDTFLAIADADAMLALAAAAQARTLQLRQNAWGLKDAIEAAADHAALDAIDVEDGWSA